MTGLFCAFWLDIEAYPQGSDRLVRPLWISESRRALGLSPKFPEAAQSLVWKGIQRLEMGMSKPGFHKDGILQQFHEELDAFLDKNNYRQFFANSTNDGVNTFLCSDIFQAEKISTFIIEEYSARDKFAGNVVLALPDPDYNVPIFSFQLGGVKKKIALLDISPTGSDIDYSPLAPVFEKYRDALDVKPAKLKWVKEISSPYLLHCQYEELDTDLFLEATFEYLKVWIEHFYIPGKKVASDAERKAVEQGIYKFKRVLHDNDPAYKLFKRDWGQPVADAFFYTETHDEPALAMPGEEGHSAAA